MKIRASIWMIKTKVFLKFHMKWFSNFLVPISFVLINSELYAAGAQCFSYEVFQHEPNPGVAASPAVAAHSSLANYDHGNILANHPAIRAAPIPIQINIRHGGMPNLLWAIAMPFAGAPPPLLNLANVNAVVARRFAHQVPIADQLIVKLNAANIGGAMTPQLQRSLTNGGYLNEMAALLYQLTLGVFPLGAILGAGFIPDSIIVHIALPQRVSKNLRELSHSSLSTAVGNITLKDRIDAAYIALGMPVPDSATIVTSHQLQ